MGYIVATTKSNFEFRTADAINDAGGFAVVPRRVEIVKDKAGKVSYDYRPFLPNFIFCAISEQQWHEYQTKRLFGTSGILPLMRRELDILPRTWIDFQGFAERAERACDLRIEQFEAGRRAWRYRKNDMIEIIGSEVLNGQLKGCMARFVRIDGKGRIEAIVDGVTIMGKPVRVAVDPGDVRMAAE